jgi:hypothetical protein
MPRRARLSVAGIPWHIIQRGNKRSPCFYSDEDYSLYLHYLGELSKKFSCAVHAYVLMTNPWRLTRAWSGTKARTAAIFALLRGWSRGFKRHAVCLGNSLRLQAQMRPARVATTHGAKRRGFLKELLHFDSSGCNNQHEILLFY